MIVERQMDHVWFYAFLLLSFLFGDLAASGLMTGAARLRGMRSKYMLPLVAEAAMLAAFSVGISVLQAGHPLTGVMMYWMCGAAAFAMGLQNATVTSISGAVVRTTHLTGVTTDLGLEGDAADLVVLGPLALRGGSNRAKRLIKTGAASHRQRMALLATSLGRFFGAIIGTLVSHNWPAVGLIPPVVFLVGILTLALRKPIADVRELDLLSDPELRCSAS